MQYKSGKENPPFPNNLKHYRVLAQENHLQKYNKKLHIGLLEAGADINHQYWEMMEREVRNARLNIKRGICLVLQKHIPEFTGMDIDTIVDTVFPPVPVKGESEQKPELKPESKSEEPVIPTPTQGVDEPAHEIKEVQIEAEETEKEESEIDEIQHRKSNGEICVFTNGCFDILHAGHIHILKKAREMGDFLVLGLNSDESVTRLKGEGRPVNDVTSRETILKAIRYVDYVLVFEGDTPRELILQIQPNILVKGGDYEPDFVVGADIVELLGGRVEIVPLLEGFSTSNMIQQLSENDWDDSE